MSIKVLLVDDHKIMREGLRSIISEQTGISVVGEAANGREAVKLAEKLKPDLVVMDLSMPELNGIEATGEIVSSNPYIKVLALSMHSEKMFITRALQEGASGYILKDCALEELIQAIRTVMSGRVYISPDVADVVLSDYRQLLNSETSMVSKLTKREREVLQLIAEGSPTKVIAVSLNLSVKTIETHRSQLMNKLDLHSIAELTKFAIKEGIIELD